MIRIIRITPIIDIIIIENNDNDHHYHYDIHFCHYNDKWYGKKVNADNFNNAKALKKRTRKTYDMKIEEKIQLAIYSLLHISFQSKI